MVSVTSRICFVPNVFKGTVVPPYSGPTVETFLQKLGKLDLIQYMKKYWVSQGGPNTDFWAHEFSKHATCFSTFQTECYGPRYVKHEDLVDFYQTAILYYRRLPTWKWLAQAGIQPSNSTNYTLSNIQTALSKGYGATPYLGCSGPRYNTTEAGKGSKDTGFTVLSEAWYYFNVWSALDSDLMSLTNFLGIRSPPRRRLGKYSLLYNGIIC